MVVQNDRVEEPLEHIDVKNDKVEPIFKHFKYFSLWTLRLQIEEKSWIEQTLMWMSKCETLNYPIIQKISDWILLLKRLSCQYESKIWRLSLGTLGVGGPVCTHEYSKLWEGQPPRTNSSCQKATFKFWARTFFSEHPLYLIYLHM